MTFERIDAPCPDATLRHDARGEVQLSDYWQEGVTVFLFLRHFG